MNPAYFKAISTDYHHFVQAFAREAARRDPHAPQGRPPRGVGHRKTASLLQKHPLPSSPPPATPPSRSLDGGLGPNRHRRHPQVPRSPRGRALPRQRDHLERLNRFVPAILLLPPGPGLRPDVPARLPLLPFGPVCLNGHEWLACRLRAAGIAFEQGANAFRTCADRARLQDTGPIGSRRRTSRPAATAGWPSWSPSSPTGERRHQGFGYRLFVSQVEYCTNLVFRPPLPALDRLHGASLDLNRSIGYPDRIAMIFGRRITKHTDAGLKTQILEQDLGQPVIRSEYKSSSIKQYARDNLVLRTQTTSYPHARPGGEQGRGAPAGVAGDDGHGQRPLPRRAAGCPGDIRRSRPVERVAAPTVSPSGRRTPGLKFDDPRLLAVLQARPASPCWRDGAASGRPTCMRLWPKRWARRRRTTPWGNCGMTWEAARQGAGGADRRHAGLPTAVGGVPDRGAVPEVVPPDLRTADGRDP